VEPITADPARPARAVLAMSLADVAFLHWPADPGLVAALLPSGTRPDLFAGASYVGLIALQMRRVGLPGLPPVPYLGTFPQVNVRLYAVGPDGQRGVVFRSLDAARLAPALAGRIGFGLPYRWARVAMRRRGDVLTCESSRRWPGPAARLRLRLRIGDNLAEPSALEHFLTARWGLLAARRGGRVAYLPNEHPRWPLRRAEVLELAQDLLPAAGLAAGALAAGGGEPASVLYSPGVRMRSGLPQRC